MKNLKDIKTGDIAVIPETGDIAVIPEGTEFWSIALQELVVSTRAIVIKITSICMDTEYVYGNIQIVFKNLALASIIGLKQARGYNDKTNGEICIQYENLIEDSD